MAKKKSESLKSKNLPEGGKTKKKSESLKNKILPEGGNLVAIKLIKNQMLGRAGEIKYVQDQLSKLLVKYGAAKLYTEKVKAKAKDKDKDKDKEKTKEPEDKN